MRLRAYFFEGASFRWRAEAKWPEDSSELAADGEDGASCMRDDVVRRGAIQMRCGAKASGRAAHAEDDQVGAPFGGHV